MSERAMASSSAASSTPRSSIKPVKDSTVGSEKPLRELGAVMADTIGAAR
jgi:hypothetical protein